MKGKIIVTIHYSVRAGSFGDHKMIWEFLQNLEINLICLKDLFEEITTLQNYQLDRKEYIDMTLQKSIIVGYRPTSQGFNDKEIAISKTRYSEETSKILHDQFIELEISFQRSSNNCLYTDNSNTQPKNIFAVSSLSKMISLSYGN